MIGCLLCGSLAVAIVEATQDWRWDDADLYLNLAEIADRAFFVQ